MSPDPIILRSPSNEKTNDFKRMYDEALTRNITAGLAQIEGLGSLGHRGIEGRIHEVFVKDILRPLTPSGFEITSGKIIDRHGMLTSQIDLIVYDGRFLRPIILDGEMSIVPVEIVQYAIEVKKTATKSGLKRSAESMAKLYSLDNIARHTFIRTMYLAFARPASWTTKYFINAAEPCTSEHFPPLNIGVMPGIYTSAERIVSPEYAGFSWGIPENVRTFSDAIRWFCVGYVNTLIGQVRTMHAAEVVFGKYFQ